MLTTLGLILRFESMGHVCILGYLQLTNLASFGSPSFAQSGQFGGILLSWLEKWVLGTLLTDRMCFLHLFRVISNR